MEKRIRLRGAAPFQRKKATQLIGKLCGENRDISRKVHKQMVFIIQSYFCYFKTNDNECQ